MPFPRRASVAASRRTRGGHHRSGGSPLGAPVADSERTSGWPHRRLRRPGRRRLSGHRPAILRHRSPHRRSCPSGANASPRLGGTGADRRWCSSRAATVRNERRRRGRPPVRPRHRSGILRHGTGTTLQGRDRGAARAAHAVRSDDGRRAAVWRRDGALHVGHRAHPAGGGPRDRPGVTQRDRIRSGVPHATIPRIARRAAEEPRHASHSGDACHLHLRSRQPAPRRARGTRAGHVRARSSISSAMSRRQPARRARTST